MKRNKRTVGAVAGLVVLLVTLSTAACRGQARTSADLQRMADEMMPRVEALSGLPAKKPVQLELQDRAAMRRYVEGKLAEEWPADELAGVKATYAALGLIPESLDLQKLLLDLYTEQVVGYYDPGSKALYLVKGAPAGDVRTVLAHELVHALQDQHADLDSLVSRRRGNDRQSAAQAALEGHATLVMFAQAIEKQLGKPLRPEQLPDMGAQLAPTLEAQNAQFPVFQNAPRVIRETLLFPYVGGAAYAQSLWRGANPDGQTAEPRFPAPLAEHLPLSTEQVLHPDRAHDLPTELQLEATAAGWRTLYENTLGELETGIVLKEHLGAGAERAAAGWDGDRYRLLEAPGGGRALVWYSVWDDAASADRFADAYRRVLEHRTGRQGRVERFEVDGRPVVRVIDADTAVELSQLPIPALVRMVEG
jgi:hypothetical protein